MDAESSIKGVKSVIILIIYITCVPVEPSDIIPCRRPLNHKEFNSSSIRRSNINMCQVLEDLFREHDIIRSDLGDDTSTPFATFFLAVLYFGMLQKNDKAIRNGLRRFT